ncbi:MAG: hypothetical protein H6637_05145 [Ardenticatenales bacterium]|nr:hypothetical protein [Ardenticatenales bacterium]
MQARRLEINGVEIAGPYAPEYTVVVHPQPVARALESSIIYGTPWPVAYLHWPGGILDDALLYWRALVGSATDILIPDPEGTSGPITRGLTTYYDHAEYSSGVVLPPPVSASHATVPAGEHLLVRGPVVITIEHLGRF